MRKVNIYQAIHARNLTTYMRRYTKHGYYYYYY